ncbi:MAG: CYTH domain-containing protein [Chloroflexi bacterium]|nr:CYTH domain-containing protein [Chloroflexota bacterium]
MGDEVEIKLAPKSNAVCRELRDEVVERQEVAGCRVVGQHVETQLNVYYDTPSGRLELQAAALRLRRIAEHPETAQLTFKQAGRLSGSSGVVARRELTAVIAGAMSPTQLDAQALPLEPLRSALVLAGGEPLLPLTASRTRREAFAVRAADGTEIEIVFDQMLPFVGEPVSEIELELVSGPRSTLERVGRELSSRVGPPAFETKLARLRAGRRTLPVEYALDAVVAEVRFRAGTGAATAPVLVLAGPEANSDPFITRLQSRFEREQLRATVQLVTNLPADRSVAVLRLLLLASPADASELDHRRSQPAMMSFEALSAVDLVVF